MPTRIAAVALALPLIVLGVLMFDPGSDKMWAHFTFHFWIDRKSVV